MYLIAQDDTTIPGAKKNMTASSSKADKEVKGFISFKVGPAVPLGDFRDYSISNDNAGFALTGVSVSFNAGYLFYKGFGAAFTWMGAANYVNENQIGAVLNSSPYLTGAISVGPMYIHSINEKFFYDVHMLFGTSAISNPDFGGVLSVQTSNSFAFTLGFSGKFILIKKLYLSGNLDFFSANPYFSVGSFYQPISIMSLNGGLGIKF